MLLAQPERRTAGGEDLQRWARGQKVAELRGRIEDMLAVVEHEENLTWAQGGDDSGNVSSVAPHTDGEGDGGKDEVGVTERGEVDEHHPIGEGRRHVPGDRQSEASLADPAGASQR